MYSKRKPKSQDHRQSNGSIRKGIETLFDLNKKDAELPALIRAANAVIKNGGATPSQKSNACDKIMGKARKLEDWKTLEDYARKGLNFKEGSFAYGCLRQALIKQEKWQELEEVSCKSNDFSEKQDLLENRMYSLANLNFALQKQEKWQESLDVSKIVLDLVQANPEKLRDWEAGAKDVLENVKKMLMDASESRDDIAMGSYETPHWLEESQGYMHYGEPTSIISGATKSNGAFKTRTRRQ